MRPIRSLSVSQLRTFEIPRSRLWAAVVLAGVLLLLAGCQAREGGKAIASPTVSPLGPNLITLEFQSASGSKAELHVRVEATEQAREQGLMNVVKLPSDEGDLFAWADVAPHQDVQAPFWMKDTVAPLSIAFVSVNGQILEEQDMLPETETYHTPRLPYRFAIEANQGWYEQHGLPAGSVVNLPAALDPLNLPVGPLILPPPPPPPPPLPPASLPTATGTP